MVAGLSSLYLVCTVDLAILDWKHLPVFKTLYNCGKQESITLSFFLNKDLKWGCSPTQGRYFRPFFPKPGQGFKPSAAPLYPNIGKVLPPAGEGRSLDTLSSLSKTLGAVFD